MTMTDLRYPIGEFIYTGESDDEGRKRWIGQIAETPKSLREAVKGLTPEQVETPYRPGGWTVRQVVHHLPDSHINAYIRFKLALTEDEPTITPYDQARWAELEDSLTVPIEVSLIMLETLHERWVVLLRSMAALDFGRRFRHPEHGRLLSLNEALAMYAWHGLHHIAHITSLKSREGW